jgi:hypothetical protein
MPNVRCRKVPAVPAAEPAVLQVAGDLLPLTIPCGPDPLHLAAVFGLDEKTAIRYANAARALLESPAEQYAAPSSLRTQASTPALQANRPLDSP